MDFDFADIRDPATGLKLLAERSPEGQQETWEQQQTHLFWHSMFSWWNAWLSSGDSLAVARAVYVCSMLNEPPPRWLSDAVMKLVERHMPDGEKRLQGDLAKHYLRWEAVQLARGQRPLDARNKKPGHFGDESYSIASGMLDGTEAAGKLETVRASYSLIQRAGGKHVTLASYKRVVQERDQHRKRRQDASQS
jgi:hypothetical protein